jgi:chromosome segregation ATPase
MELEDLVATKADLERRKERLLCKLDSAKANLAEIDKRLVEKGIDPETLSDEIERLKAQRNELTAKLTKALEEAEMVLSRVESRVESL